MQYRTFGRTGWQISEIGIGTWGMGGLWGPLDDAESIRALHKAIDSGVNFIDTAWIYGEGHSEEVIAKALESRKEEVYIATKIPPKNMSWPAREHFSLEDVFPADWIIQCTEDSLRRLKRERIDLQQLHIWTPHWMEQRDSWLSAIECLKKEGKVKAFGISLNDNEPDTGIEIAASGLLDSIQVIYNIFEQAPVDKLFPTAQKYNVGIIVRVPFDEGGLTGRLTHQTIFDQNDWRKDYFKGDRLKETVDRAEAIKGVIDNSANTFAQGALKFCLSHPAVSTVIPGMRRVSHVEENCSVSDGKGLESSVLEQLTSHAWSRNFYPATVASSE